MDRTAEIIEIGKTRPRIVFCGPPDKREEVLKRERLYITRRLEKPIQGIKECAEAIEKMIATVPDEEWATAMASAEPREAKTIHIHVRKDHGPLAKAGGRRISH